MSTELQAKLEQAKARKADIAIKMDSLGPSLKTLVELQENRRDGIALIDEVIAALEKQIADEAKPKLRHGDYGLNSSKEPFVVGNERIGPICTDGYGNFDEPYYAEDCSPILGNIFDDLTAMQETVTEFEVVDEDNAVMTARITGKHLYIDVEDEDSDEVTVRITDVAAFRLKICQLEATLKRNK